MKIKDKFPKDKFWYSRAFRYEEDETLDTDRCSMCGHVGIDSLYVIKDNSLQNSTFIKHKIHMELVKCPECTYMWNKTFRQ